YHLEDTTMATKKKPSTKTKPTYKGKKKPPNVNRDYVILRTYLDSLELGALRYVLSAPTAHAKHQRAEEVEGLIKPIIDFLWKTKEEMDCPEGYIDCHGVCVSYPAMTMSQFQ